MIEESQCFTLAQAVAENLSSREAIERVEEKLPDTFMYHHPCYDGYACAYLIEHLAYVCDKHIQLIPISYNKGFPQEALGNVLVADFSFKLPLEMSTDTVRTLTVIDHHESAFKQYKGTPFIEYSLDKNYDHFYEEYKGTDVPHRAFIPETNTRSGVGLLWDYFFPGQLPPKLLAYIQDSDLFTFSLPNSIEISAYVHTASLTYASFSRLDNQLLHNHQQIVFAGIALRNQSEKLIREIVNCGYDNAKIGGVTMPFIRMPYPLVSQAGSILARDFPAVAFFTDYKGTRKVSLRSSEFNLRAVNVAEIAEKFGGGGHKHASGFSVPLDWKGE